MSFAVLLSVNLKDRMALSIIFYNVLNRISSFDKSGPQVLNPCLKAVLVKYSLGIQLHLMSLLSQPVKVSEVNIFILGR